MPFGLGRPILEGVSTHSWPHWLRAQQLSSGSDLASETVPFSVPELSESWFECLVVTGWILWWKYFIMSSRGVPLCLGIGRTDVSNFNVSVSHQELITRARFSQPANEGSRVTGGSTRALDLGRPGFEFRFFNLSAVWLGGNTKSQALVFSPPKSGSN